MKKLLQMLLFSLLLLTLTGCASISLQHSAKDATLPAKKYQKLLIVGITEQSQRRQIFEEVFAAELQKRGVTAIPSYTITGVTEKLTWAAGEDAVRKTGADGAITTRLVALKKDTSVNTGYVMTSHGFADGYGVHVTYATFIHQPVEVLLSTKMAIETNLFDAATGRLVWTGTSSAVDPEGIITFSRGLAEVVFKDMAKDGLI
jgi:hypothetical protein